MMDETNTKWFCHWSCVGSNNPFIFMMDIHIENLIWFLNKWNNKCKYLELTVVFELYVIYFIFPVIYHTFNHLPISDIACTAHTHTHIHATSQQKLHLQHWIQMLPNVDDSPSNHWLNIQFTSSPTHSAPTVLPPRNAAYPGLHSQLPGTTPLQSATAWSGLSPTPPWDGMN